MLTQVLASQRDKPEWECLFMKVNHLNKEKIVFALNVSTYDKIFSVYRLSCARIFSTRDGFFL